MTLEAGTRLGPYEIEGPLGAGGMGEVYRARDSRLARTVAIKVLPGHLSDAPESKQRFEREARVISSLSHPHICTLYDVGHHEGIDYLVMEHLEGETLAQRLGRGAVPLEQALEIGIQAADALDRAHKSGVIHRDLKPANIMLTSGGVKLLDFGLAKHQLPESVVSSGSFALTMTETPASAPLTVEGTILGTFQYMAPEQIEGREADARSDIFAFGAVLYEMATGHRAFSGKSQASLIGSIMHARPEAVSKLAPASPPALDRVVATCLAKDPDQRWHTAHDVKLQLQWIAEGGSQVGLPAPVAARRRSRERVAWAAAGLATVVALTFAVLWAQRAPESPQQVRFEVDAPKDLPVVDSPKLSPDGRYLAFSATDQQGRSMIWVRPLNGIEATPLAGTEGTTRPFWSPDSRFLAFFADGKLKKIAVTGGPPQTVCDAPRGADGSWSDDGTILYDGRDTDPIMRVAAGGGIPVESIKPESTRGEAQVGWPQFLPGSRKFLYVGFGTSEPAVKLASLDGGEIVTLLPGQSRVEYAPPGHLLYVREGTLVAQPFDAGSGKITGDPVPLAEDLNIDAVGLAHFTTSQSGVLAFRGGEVGNGQLQWLDRKGLKLEDVGESADIYSTDLSPDGRWLAMQLSSAQSRGDDIWIRDLVRGVTSRFTFNEGDDVSPLWSPDGRRIAFSQFDEGDFDLAVKAVGGSGEVEVLLDSAEGDFPSSWSPDGASLLFLRWNAETNDDVWLLPLEDRAAVRPFVRTPFNESRAHFSPDGRWVAYQSDESGRDEIYVQAFPGPGGKWQISTAGGREAGWGPDGRELFYITPEMTLMRVAVQTGASFDAGVPEKMFAVRLRPVRTRRRYLLSADGQRILILGTLEQDMIPPTTVILNWNAELGR